MCVIHTCMECMHVCIHVHMSVYMCAIPCVVCYVCTYVLMSSHHSNGISSGVQTHTTNALDTARTYTYSCTHADTNYCISGRCLKCTLRHSRTMYTFPLHTPWTCHKAQGMRYSNYLISSALTHGGFISTRTPNRPRRLDGTAPHGNNEHRKQVIMYLCSGAWDN